jgi:hypothetical protein
MRFKSLYYRSAIQSVSGCTRTMANRVRRVYESLAMKSSSHPRRVHYSLRALCRHIRLRCMESRRSNREHFEVSGRHCSACYMVNRLIVRPCLLCIMAQFFKTLFGPGGRNSSQGDMQLKSNTTCDKRWNKCNNIGFDQPSATHP